MEWLVVIFAISYLVWSVLFGEDRLYVDDKKGMKMLRIKETMAMVIAMIAFAYGVVGLL